MFIRINIYPFLLTFLIALLSQNAAAVSFAPSYKITVNGETIGQLVREHYNNGQVYITLHLQPAMPENQVSVEQIKSAKTPHLSLYLRHYQTLSGSTSDTEPSLPTGFGLASLSRRIVQLIMGSQENLPPLMEPIYMALTESQPQGSSITIELFNTVMPQSLSSIPEGMSHSMRGSKNTYTTDSEGGFLFTRKKRRVSEDEDEDIYLGEHMESINDVQNAVISHSGQQPLTTSFFMFSPLMEATFSDMAAGGGDIPLAAITSIFPVLDMAVTHTPSGGVLMRRQPSIGHMQVLIQALSYDPHSNTITQQDPPNDPEPSNTTTVYHINSNGIISHITVQEEGGETVNFEAELNLSLEDPHTSPNARAISFGINLVLKSSKTHTDSYL